MTEERGRWYLLTGFVIGALLGLALAWLVFPREYQDTSPASLRANFKDEYRALIAAAYVANGNLPRAKARLDLLRDGDQVRALSEQAQRTLAEGRSPHQAQALALLALALGQGPSPLSVTPPSSVSTSPGQPTGPAEATTPVSGNTAVPSPTPAPGLTQTPGSGGTPLPTRTPTTTSAAPLVLKNQTFVCDQSLAGPLLQVFVEDQGQPVPGVELVVRWEGGEDHFFTGVKPELGLGYADYSMQPGVVYTLQLAGGVRPVTGLTAAECEAQGGGRYWGSWRLVFGQP